MIRLQQARTGLEPDLRVPPLGYTRQQAARSPMTIGFCSRQDVVTCRRREWRYPGAAAYQAKVILW